MDRDNTEPVVVQPGPGTLTLTPHAPAILMKTSLWNNWARIAIAHTVEAMQHRAAWRSGVLRNIQPEMHASMVAVTAVAFAIEALHADIAPLVDRSPDARVGRGRQRGYVLDTYRTASAHARLWQKELDWLFALRDNAVHFQGRLHEPVWDERFSSNVAEENLLFSAESAERAVAFLLVVVRALFGGSAGLHPSLTEWSRAHRHVLDELAVLYSE